MSDLEVRLRRKIRAQGKADSTADAYWEWCRQFLDYCASRGVGRETKAEDAVEQWLTSLANDRDLAANSQNVAFSALCYLYREVLKRPLEGVSALRAKRPQRIRDIADQSEIVALFDELRGPSLLSARMMYGSNFRIGELGRLCMKDLSFQRKQIVIRGAKGQKDRIVGFPAILHEAVRRQVESMRVLWKHDVTEGLNGVSLPKAWSRKSSSSHLDFAWWYLFASDNYSKCPKSGRMLRHHRDMGNIARQIKQAAKRAGITKRITSHCLRHSYATHSLEQGVPIHVLQKLMGHSSIETTETYLHVAKDGATAAKSPIEALPELADALERPQRRTQTVTDGRRPRLRIVG